jgi:predicted permease
MRFRRAFRLFGRSRGAVAAEVDEELRFHLDERTAELEAGGLGPRAAREAAMAEMGDLDEVRRSLVSLTERRRRREGWTMKLEGLMQDLRYAARTLRRSPGYALTVILTLTVGIGATASVFSVMNPFFFRPLPFPDAEQLIQLGHVDRESGFEWARFSLPQIADYRERVGGAAAIGHYYYGSYNLTDGDRPERATGGVVSTNTFSGVLRATPLLGRNFTPEEGLPGAPDVVLLAHPLWTARYAADPSIVGSTIRIDGRPHEVIGVMGEEVVFPFGGVRFWLPNRSTSTDRGSQGNLMIARLSDGVDREDGIAEFAAVHAALASAWPDVDGRWDGLHGAPLKEALNFIWDLLRLSFTAFLGAVLGVLVIACVNVTGITLARTQSRIRELGVRSSLGAGRARLVRQLVSESVLLAVIGGVLGTAAAAFLTQGLGDILPADIYRVGNPTLDVRVLLFALAVTASAPLVFGLWPALAVSRRNLASLIREGTVRGGQSRGSRRLRRGLVIGEVGVGVALVAVTGLFLQSARAAADSEIGFEPGRMLIATATTPAFDYADATEVGAFWENARQSVAEAPGVEAAGVVFPLLLNNELFAARMGIPGDAVEPTERPAIFRLWASEGYFEAAGIRQISGRTLTAADTAGDMSGVVVSAGVAERFWPGVDPLGRTLELGENRVGYRVVGVVADQAHDGIDGTPDALVYLPIEEYTGRRRFMVARAAGDPLAVSQPVRAAISAVDPGLPVDLQPMDDLVFQATFQWSAGSGVLAAFGLLALLLASIGVYGIVAHTVEERRHEMAVRMSLGADASRVGGQVIRDSMALTGWGIGIGLVLAFLAARAAQAILYGGAGADPVVLAIAAGVFVAVGVIAAIVPARRASRIEPVALLRTE